MTPIAAPPIMILASESSLMLRLVRSIRELSEAKIIIGGAAIGVMPEEILRFSGADYAVLGDGEFTTPELLARISNGDAVTTPGVAHISDGEFQSTPRSTATLSGACMIPDFSRWINVGAYLSRMSTVTLQTKLGCRYKCVYCTYRKIEGCLLYTSDAADEEDS